MKKLLSILLVVSMLFSLAAMSVSAASADKTATFTFKASVLNASSKGQAQDKTDFLNASNKIVYNSKDGKTINVYPGQVVWVTLHLKTGDKYYAGDLQTYVFYSTNIFKSTDQGQNCYIWNNDGKYTSICAKNGAPFSKMKEEAVREVYPSSWSEAQRKDWGLYSVIMYPNSGITSTVKSNVDDDLVTFPIYVRSDAKTGEKGTICLPPETIKSSSNTSGKFILSNYPTGKITEQNITYSKDYGLDVSKAKLDFVVCDKNTKMGDVNNDSKINSSDALFVLQAATGSTTLSEKQIVAADVNKDKKINSSDALKILQFATGIITKF